MSGDLIIPKLDNTNTQNLGSPNIKKENDDNNQENTIFMDHSKAHKVVVLDDFNKSRATDVGGKTGFLTHGDAIAEISRKLCPIGVRVKEIELNNSFPTVSELNKNSHTDALNLSFGVELTYKELSSIAQKEITPENVAENKTLIKDLMKNKSIEIENKLKQNPNYKLSTLDKKLYVSNEIINTLQDYSKAGIKVFVPSGNWGKNGINAIAFSDKAEVVDATNADGDLAFYSSHSSLSTQKAQGTYGINNIKGKGFGICINGINTENPTIADPQATTEKGLTDTIIGKTLDDIKKDNSFKVKELAPDKYYITDNKSKSSEIFTKAKNGKLNISDGVSSGYEATINGTSFASPNAMSEDVRRKMLTENMEYKLREQNRN